MTFRKVDERDSYRGPFLRVVQASFESPDGERFEREFVRHTGAVAVVLVDDGRVVLTRQFRAAVGEELLEIPAGLLDVDGESPDDAARRELEEEVGRRATGPLEPLVTYVPSAGMADHRVQVFLCTESEPCDVRPGGAEERHMTIQWLALTDAIALIDSGGITDGKTIVGLLLASERLARR